MTELSQPLSDAELDQLDGFLLDRVPEDADTDDLDEGITDVSELDGFLTAVVSGPVTIPPSQWLPAVWGDFEPTWDEVEEFQEIFTLFIRHMNAISDRLMNMPEEFEPLFFGHEVKGKSYLIVDEWCEGYRIGVDLAASAWSAGGEEVIDLLAPIYAFTEQTEWAGHNYEHEEVEKIQQFIAPNIRMLHAFWLGRRQPHSTGPQPVRNSSPKTGRNDPCPCGSGKKYKHCCLH